MGQEFLIDRDTCLRPTDQQFHLSNCLEVGCTALLTEDEIAKYIT